MIRRPPRSTRTDTLFPYTTLFRSGLVEIFERRARQFELPRGFKADRPIAARQRDDMPALDHRFPAETGERHQQVADAAGFVVGRRAVVAGAIDDFLVFGAAPPPFARLFRLEWRRVGNEGVRTGRTR